MTLSVYKKLSSVLVQRVCIIGDFSVRLFVNLSWLSGRRKKKRLIFLLGGGGWVGGGSGGGWGGVWTGRSLTAFNHSQRCITSVGLCQRNLSKGQTSLRVCSYVRVRKTRHRLAAFWK